MGSVNSIQKHKSVRAIQRDEEKRCLGDIPVDILVNIVSFVANKQPASLTQLRHVNNHWNSVLDPNKYDVNMIWENNICRQNFPFIPHKLKMKRWDRYFKYKYVMVFGSNSANTNSFEYFGFRRNSANQNRISELNKPAPILYEQHKIIEGCTFDIDSMNNQFNKESELPNGYEYKLKCPIKGLKLEKRGTRRSYCNVCKKNVFHVRNVEELEQKVNNGQCVSFMIDNSDIRRPRGR
eukprot:189846_1